MELTREEPARDVCERVPLLQRLCNVGTSIMQVVLCTWAWTLQLLRSWRYTTTCMYLSTVSSTIPSNLAPARANTPGVGEAAVSVSDGTIWTTGGGFSSMPANSRPSYQDAAVSKYLASGMNFPTGQFNSSGRACTSCVCLCLCVCVCVCVQVRIALCDVGDEARRRRHFQNFANWKVSGMFTRADLGASA